MTVELFEAAELLLFFNQAKFILETKGIKEIKMKLAERDGRIRRSDSVLNSATKWLNDLGFITFGSRGLGFLICKPQSIALHLVPMHVVRDSCDSAVEELCNPRTTCGASDAGQIEGLHTPDPVLVL